MKESNDFLFDEDSEYQAIVKRYEQMLRSRKPLYFDVAEFESIIDYYLDNNLFDKALIASDYAIQQHPNSSLILLKKCNIALENGYPVEALKMLEYLERVEPNNYEVFLMKGNANCLMNNIKRAVREFDRALHVSYDNREETLYRIGMAFQQVNHYKLSIKYLEEAYSLDPENDSVIYELAYGYEKINEIEKSIDYYTKYLDEEPFSENVWYNVGVLYNKLNNFEKAIDSYDFAIAIDDYYSSAYFNKANTLANHGEFEQAIETYKAFLYLEPENTQAMCYLGECYEKLKKYNNAIEYYLKTLNVDLEYPDAWFGLGMVEMYRENYDDSLEYIKRALEVDEENPEYYYIFAKINARLGNNDEAKYAYLKPVEYDPTDFEAWLFYSEIFYEEKNYIKAISVLESSYQYTKDIAEINYQLAVYYFLIKNQNTALAYFKTGLELNHNLHKLVFKKFPFLEDIKKVKSLINKGKSNKDS